MIASLDKESDIYVYIEAEEIQSIKQHLTGTLIKIYNPREQGTINLYYTLKQVLPTPQRDIIPVEVDIRVPKANIYLTPDIFEEFIKTGRYGTRYGHMGSKIKLRDISRMDSLDREIATHLEFYRDNRDSLRIWNLPYKLDNKPSNQINFLILSNFFL